MGKITNVNFIKESQFDPTEVEVTLEDGSKKIAFSYFEDEISFTENELIGLTEDEAVALFHKKDVEYLQS